MRVIRNIIEIDEERCDGCGQCVISCAEGALEIIDGKARLVSEVYCDGLGACIGECPQGALRMVQREADEFDHEAVEEFLRTKEQGEPEPSTARPLPACPSALLQTFERPGAGRDPSGSEGAEESALAHWPVQIRLVPAKAPFLRDADLLVTADCTPVAYAGFHRDFLGGKVVLMGCPKFDDVQDYLARFTDIFATASIRSVTILTMEVPCCSALPAIVRKAMEQAGSKIPVEEVVISTQGRIVERNRSSAQEEQRHEEDQPLSVRRIRRQGAEKASGP